MEQVIRYQDGIGEITLSGRFDATAAPLFDAWFSANNGPASGSYLLNLAEVPYITSAGLRSILKVLKQVEAGNGRLALCCVTSPVQDLFKMAGFASFLQLYDTSEAALAALTGPPAV